MLFDSKYINSLETLKQGFSIPFSSVQRNSRFYIGMLIFLSSFCPIVSSQPVHFLEENIFSKSGYFKLSWNSTDAQARYTLEYSLDETFSPKKVWYQGPDNASFISGLKSGTYYFRIREGSGDWSPPLVATVQHHSKKLAYGLFIAGAVLFFLTVWLIISGARSAREDL